MVTEYFVMVDFLLPRGLLERKQNRSSPILQLPIEGYQTVLTKVNTGEVPPLPLRTTRLRFLRLEVLTRKKRKACLVVLSKKIE
jgi:hypothetical protein